MPRTIDTDLYTQAVNALKQKVSGYILEESKKTYLYEAGKKRVKDEVLVKKEVGPDLSAIQFVLTNLNPGQWSQKPDEKNSLQYNDTEGKPDLSLLSQAALDELNRLCEE